MDALTKNLPSEQHEKIALPFFSEGATEISKYILDTYSLDYNGTIEIKRKSVMGRY